MLVLKCVFWCMMTRPEPCSQWKSGRGSFDNTFRYKEKEQHPADKHRNSVEDSVTSRKLNLRDAR